MKIILIVPCFLFLFLPVPFSQVGLSASADSASGLYLAEKQTVYNTNWVDSVLNSLSLEQKIAQLMMIRVQTDQAQSYYDEKARLVQQYNIGGVAFFKGTPHRQLMFTNQLQSLVQTPLLVAMDAEWGPSMRLDSTLQFPRQMSLGAIRGERLIYDMGFEIGKQLKRLGVHINFAPVVDVNNNPANPVINFRSFGEGKHTVAHKGSAYMRGLQDAGIIACAKHFPGHGDTDADSHHTLPFLKHRLEEIKQIHLYPFQELISQGVDAIMTAHLEVPALESRKNLASSLSPNVVSQLLQEQMGFTGLIITDALDMKGVSNFFKPGELELQALIAGNDILLLPENVPAAIQAIKQAIDSGRIEEDYVIEKCRKVLFYKQKAGLDRFSPLSPNRLTEDLNNPKAKRLISNLAQSSITLVRNADNLLPVQLTAGIKIASLSIGGQEENYFQPMLNNYHPVSMFSVSKSPGREQVSQLLTQLEGYDLVIISVHNNSMFVSRRYGFTDESISLINQIAKQNKTILSLFANPYSLDYFGDDVLETEAIVVGYEEGQNYEEAVAQVIFGGQAARGKLPVSVKPHFPLYTGISTPDNFRLGFGLPEDVGIYSHLLQGIDSIVEAGIKMKAFPGCQIVIAKDGQVFYNKSFGHHTYEKQAQVLLSDIYDVASVTKISATTAAIMRMVDYHHINLDQKLDYYLPWLQNTNKAHITIRELLAHQGRFHPWIPFFSETLAEGKPHPDFYQPQLSEFFPLEVGQGLYLRKDYRDTIFSRIIQSPLADRPDYRYSDLGFILLAEIVEQISGMPLDQYMSTYFYEPMGLSSIGFYPLRRFLLSRIIPSEKDMQFRKQIIHGHVNDPAAAMLGGASGHAGLFSNAYDLAVFMQMILQGGTYGGKRYISEQTIQEFTSVQFAGNQNRRGLGFDKPSLRRDETGPAAAGASAESYGHSGFTGTYVWADPEENLVYVFLSNRTYPDASNRMITKENIRTNIHQIVYDAIKKSKALDTLNVP
jgi:beta-N-acetylhexosaminidase